MAGGSRKTRKVVKPDSDDEYQSEESGGYHGQQEIQATFEGRNPEGQDFHGIKQLLEQLFLSTHIDLGQMSDMIISQAGIGSVLKQSCNDSDDEEDLEMVEESQVFGVTTVLNLTQNRESPYFQQLYHLIDEESKKHSDQDTQSTIKHILQNSNVGLLLNERFVNIPSKISSLMLNTLHDELDRMKRKNAAYNFDYFLMFSKTWKPKENNAGELIFSNDEEELFYKKADFLFDYSVATKSDTGLTGNWQSEDKELIPYRAVILFKSDKFSNILNEVKSLVFS